MFPKFHSLASITYGEDKCYYQRQYDSHHEAQIQLPLCNNCGFSPIVEYEISTELGIVDPFKDPFPNENSLKQYSDKVFKIILFRIYLYLMTYSINCNSWYILDYVLR